MAQVGTFGKVVTSNLKFNLAARVLRTGPIHQRRFSGPSLSPAAPRRTNTCISGRRINQIRCASGNGAEEYDYDLLTIGAGSGGVRASRQSGDRGAKVAICELPYGYVSSESVGGVGGTCVLRGCVPKKMMVYGSEYAGEFKDSAGFGWLVDGMPKFNWKTLLENKRSELDRLHGVYKRLLDGTGVELLLGRGTLIDPHTVDVDGKRYTAKHILIATGGRPSRLPIPGAEHTITSDDALELEDCPKKIVILGAGYIAVEFAGIFTGYGADTHLVYRADRPLRGFDEEARTFIAEQYATKGMNLHPAQSPTEIIKEEDGTFTVKLKDGSGNESEIKGADKVMMATGRSPNTKGLGLEELGIETAKSGAIIVDEYSRTNVPSVWAIGDVTDRIQLTPVALMEGMALAKTIFDEEPTKPDHRNVASAVFSQPPLASVGLTEEQAIQEFGDVDVYTSSFRPLKNTVSGNEGRAFMKLIVDVATDKVVGMHMIGEDCAEIMQGMAVAVKLGATKAQLDTVVGIHPTAAEEFVTMRSVSRKVRNKEVVTV
ncbi:hypothetical protein BSKO_00130 [Bryopsis sp. KO-2023]|nr:hypothetical protein BSKO_00130 [Bryopsis sp. KO-2023]